MRGIDMLMAFPYILLALAIVAVLGPGLLNALYAIAVVNIPFFARNIRGVTLGLARREFVDAARLSGKGHARILFTEVLPNVLPVIVITMSTTVGWMILETAGLSASSASARSRRRPISARCWARGGACCSPRRTSRSSRA
jgi:peptide/nickel transport system permease protein